jgi:uncharacterized membrane protein
MGRSKVSGNEAGLMARSLALGVASGMRSSLGFAAPGLRGVRQAGFTPANTVRLLGIGGELVVDKLPQTPSRLTPPGLIARFASGGAGALQLASRSGAAPKTRAAAVAIGVAGAAGGAYGGAAWRRAAAGDSTGENGGRPDWQAAVLEDAVALNLALAASR